jgi:hypothetical protein
MTINILFDDFISHVKIARPLLKEQDQALMVTYEPNTLPHTKSHLSWYILPTLSSHQEITLQSQRIKILNS